MIRCLPNTDRLHDYSVAWVENTSCKKQEDCTYKLQLALNDSQIWKCWDMFVLTGIFNSKYLVEFAEN